MTVKDKDNGYAALMARMQELDKGSWEISIGVHEADMKKKADRDGGGYDENLTVADVATFHEFGLGNNPRRSFIGDWVDENQDKIRDWSAKQVQLYIQGKRTKEQVLSYVGSRMVGGIQQRISSNIPPELSKATADRKGSTVALIDTGQLRTSITFRIWDG